MGEPAAGARLGRFVATMHGLPVEGSFAPKARPEDLLSFAKQLTEKGALSAAGAEAFATELQQISAVLAQPTCGSAAADRLVWTHGSLSFENLLEERWPSDLAPLYEGTLSHPDLGQNIEIRVQLDSKTHGCWQALGQTEAVTVNASDGHVVFRDAAGKTKLSGALSSGFVRGEVVQDGSCGGSFVLIGLAEAKPEPQLLAVDVEMAGQRSVRTDISYLFLTWGLADDVRYPSLSIRRAFAFAYLAASGLPSDVASVDEFLWAVECESLLQAAWLGLAGTLASASSPSPPPLTPLALQLAAGLPAARAALAKAVGDVASRQAILEHGAFGVR